MPSKITLCNTALMKLGAEPLAALTDENDRAALCLQFYDDVRDAVLRAHPWNFALSRAALAQLVATPAWGFDYQYQLPSDCLRVLRLEDNYDFKIEGRKLLTDETTANILYVSRVEDPMQWDPLFVDAFATRLAAELAVPITGNRSLAETMWTLYSAKLVEARTMDGMEGTPDIFDEVTTLTEVR